MFVRTMLALLAAFSIQQVNARTDGDQSGLLADLYHAKNDYYNVMSKSMLENHDLSQMLKKIVYDLTPYANREVMMGSAWSAPIWQTTADFRAEFASENRTIESAMIALDTSATYMENLTEYPCGHLTSRFYAIRYDMRAVWHARNADSQALLAKLEDIARDADRANGPFVVRQSWLNSISYASELSDSRQAQYQDDFHMVNRELDLFIDDVRLCYNID